MSNTKIIMDYFFPILSEFLSLIMERIKIRMDNNIEISRRLFIKITIGLYEI